MKNNEKSFLKSLLKKERKRRNSLTLLFSLAILLILFVALLLASTIVSVLIYFDVITENDIYNASLIVALVAISSLVIGTAISFLFIKLPLKPINELLSHMNRLATGDFKTRLEFSGAVAGHPVFDEIADSFNSLACELDNTELLKNDFINNFSHEFKTPIVSISGLARLVNKSNLTEEQRSQYLTAIEEESLRLATMATNMLNLSKIENQAILSSVKSFNLSEQIRACVLLFEDKWTKKSLDIQLDLEEYTICANEELLKQVWINLLDNAIKFSPRYEAVSIKIHEDNESLHIKITNTGCEIRAEDKDKIWNKFYQSDPSRSTEGNGIGLAIVSRIVKLHNGQRLVESENGRVSFTIILPKRQH